jgi:hypothetical protein
MSRNGVACTAPPRMIRLKSEENMHAYRFRLKGRGPVVSRRCLEAL